MSDRIIVLSARPGRIIETIDVSLPRPRDDRTRAMPEFGRIRTGAWEILKNGIRAASDAQVVA
jgi:NitT/TauT family transport system ATP-binding protein